MIDDSKFEKLEKEDMQAISGGFKDLTELYKWTCDYCDVGYKVMPVCYNCGHKVEWFNWEYGETVFGCDYEAYMRPRD